MELSGSTRPAPVKRQDAGDPGSAALQGALQFGARPRSGQVMIEAGIAPLASVFFLTVAAHRDQLPAVRAAPDRELDPFQCVCQPMGSPRSLG
jgi:hypothetical protein